MISRLDEDLSTLGQISKLSETLSFPHQVLWATTHADNSHMFYCTFSSLSSSSCLLDSNSNKLICYGSSHCLLFCHVVKHQIFLVASIAQSLDEVIKDLMASVHRELSEKQSLAFSMTFLPTKLEFTTASAESSFVFEFASPDTRSNFEQAFEEAKKKLGQ